MKVVLSLLIAFAVVGGVIASGPSSTVEKKSIKEIMKAANAGGENSLFKKVPTGKATPEENKKFLDLLIDLVENDPPKGDGVEWKMASGTALLAAAKLEVGREGAAEELGKAVNCKACHDKFKGK